MMPIYRPEAVSEVWRGPDLLSRACLEKLGFVDHDFQGRAEGGIGVEATFF